MQLSDFVEIDLLSPRYLGESIFHLTEGRFRYIW
jgi:hypothetical protein